MAGDEAKIKRAKALIEPAAELLKIAGEALRTTESITIMQRKDSTKEPAVRRANYEVCVIHDELLEVVKMLNS